MVPDRLLSFLRRRSGRPRRGSARAAVLRPRRVVRRWSSRSLQGAVHAVDGERGPCIGLGCVKMCLLTSVQYCVGSFGILLSLHTIRDVFVFVSQPACGVIQLLRAHAPWAFALLVAQRRGVMAVVPGLSRGWETCSSALRGDRAVIISQRLTGVDTRALAEELKSRTTALRGIRSRRLSITTIPGMDAGSGRN